MTLVDPSLVFAPRRRQILQIIWPRPMTAGEINARIPDVTFGAVSQHLAKLREAGAVVVEARGQNRIYAVNRAALGPLAGALDAMWSDSLAVLKATAEADHPPRGDSDG